MIILQNTKGSVIFKNNVFELIHYSPETKQQFEKPMLIIPPFINKFYIMDLNEKKSMIKYLLEKSKYILNLLEKSKSR